MSIQGFDTGTAWDTFITAQKNNDENLREDRKSFINTMADQEKIAKEEETLGKIPSMIAAMEAGGSALAEYLQDNPDMVREAEQVYKSMQVGKPVPITPYQQAQLDLKNEEINIAKQQQGFNNRMADLNMGLKIDQFHNKQNADYNKNLTGQTETGTDLSTFEGILNNPEYNAIYKQFNNALKEGDQDTIDKFSVGLHTLPGPLAETMQSQIDAYSKIRTQSKERLELNQKYSDEVTTAYRRLNDIDALLNNAGYIESLSGLLTVKNSLNSSKDIDAYKIFESIKDSLTMENLSKMSGTKTDKDIELLANAASKLQIGSSDTFMKNQLKVIKRLYKNIINRTGEQAGGWDKVVIYPKTSTIAARYGKAITEKDIRDTMKENNETREQVIRKLELSQ